MSVIGGKFVRGPKGELQGDLKLEERPSLRQRFGTISSQVVLMRLLGEQGWRGVQ